MEKYLNDMVKSLQKLVSFNSAAGKKAAGAPFGKGVNDALVYTLGLCDGLGFSVRNMDGYCGYAEIGGGELFGVLCHLDVVPFNAPDWTHAPLGGEIDGGILYGRGTLDDKGPTIAAIYAVKALIDEGFVFGKKVRFIFGLDEEGGKWESIAYYLDREGMPPCGIAPDADFPVINSEKGKANYVITAKCRAYPVAEFYAGERANIVPDNAYLTIAYGDAISAAAQGQSPTRKTGGYGIRPDNAPTEQGKSAGIPVIADTAAAQKQSPNLSAISAAATEQGLTAEPINGGSMLKISAVGKAAHGAHPEKGDNAALKLLKLLKSLKLSPYSELYDALCDCNGKGLGIAFKDDISGKLTLNAGIFKKTGIGAPLKIEIDVRYPHNTSKEELISRLKANNPLFSIRLHSFHKPLYVPESDPLVRTLLTAYDKVTGTKSKPVSIGGATFARALDYGVAFGPVFPGALSSIHEADENISLSDLQKTAEIYCEAFRELLK
ncbi:MAG: Sapep family Mn(2+)-dependent dipeptidase [Clostridiales bacterium]|jgi:succinyl-diaminopimelate desuccinylase|nr:Sapep family Mn(2+)-dependent dipeptidase [Clostridiales bacterium]